MKQLELWNYGPSRYLVLSQKNFFLHWSAPTFYILTPNVTIIHALIHDGWSLVSPSHRQQVNRSKTFPLLTLPIDVFGLLNTSAACA